MIKRNISTKFLLITASLLLAVVLLLPVFIAAPSAVPTGDVPTHSAAFVTAEYDAAQSISWVNQDSTPLPPSPIKSNAVQILVNWGS